jgi:hypothetical protein
MRWSRVFCGVKSRTHTLQTECFSRWVFQCDQKPEKQATDKLSLTRQAWSSESRTGGQKGGEKGTFGGADPACVAAGGERPTSVTAWRSKGNSNCHATIQNRTCRTLAALRAVFELTENSNQTHSEVRLKNGDSFAVIETPRQDNRAM